MYRRNKPTSCTRTMSRHRVQEPRGNIMYRSHEPTLEFQVKQRYGKNTGPYSQKHPLVKWLERKGQNTPGIM
ncbi:hypothetical protein GDO81_017491 [Engystomops pustulosus]|uniref:Uncharacterized protein n=1 Tax=Engystomops pustulosus TaxID=76066 RepID=A0AAV7APE2_ENGPU|nr:hypothetical protein GDO81_017491 [Engystomops pustulosus]